MLHFGKHYLRCLAWLVVSEILCLILAFSFAILSAEWIRWLSLACGVLAHALLMADCASKSALEDISAYRTTRINTSPLKPILLGIETAIPVFLLWVILKCNQSSSLMLNVFLLLNAPYIQLHRLILNGADPFSALSQTRQILMALPSAATGIFVWAGYHFRYLYEKAELDAQRSGTDSRG